MLSCSIKLLSPFNEHPIMLLSACPKLQWMCTDPESVVITGAVFWHRLMTGLWPVCFCLFGVSSQLAECVGPWLCVHVCVLKRLLVLVLHHAGLLPAGAQTPQSPPFSSSLTAALVLLATPTFVCTSRVNSTLSLPVLLDHTSVPKLRQLPNWKEAFARSSTVIY